MSFFSTGLSGMVNKRRLKVGKKAAAKKDAEKKSSDKKDEGKWEMFTDAYGRPYWLHSKTGEWSYGGVGGGGLVSPVATINPSPIGYPGAVFTPSPVFAVAPPKKEKKKDGEKKKKGEGWWETMYDDDGDRYWKHTGSGKTTYKDPYF